MNLHLRSAEISSKRNERRQGRERERKDRVTGQLSVATLDQ